jgi:diguanylate cyclase (GGDEF)-like protein
MSRRRRRIGIRGQFLLLLVAVVVGVASVTAAIAAHSQRASLLEERRLRGMSVLRSWSSLCRERMLSDESINLSMWDFIDVLMKGEGSVKEVYLLDTADIYVMHNQPNIVGTRLARTDSVAGWSGTGTGAFDERDAGGTRMRFQQVIDVSGRRLGLAGVVFTSEGIEHGIQGSVIRIFLFAGLIALVGLALASVLVYQVSRPIHLLVEGVKKFGASFDPEIPESANVKIEFRSFNEIGDVRDSFNEMTTALRVSMAERKALKEESGYLRMQATTDALTELYNKRQFEEDYPNLVELAAARERPLCLLMLDMDRFKELNDTKGHAAGDQALKDLAQAIRDRTRSSERAYRLGGDEFIIISVGTGIDDARAIAGRIAEEYDRRKASGNLTTISFGIVSYDGLKTHEELLHAADQEMYRVKREKKSER